MLPLVISAFITILSPVKKTTKRTPLAITLSSSFLYESTKHKATTPSFSEKVTLYSGIKGALHVCRIERRRKKLEICPQAANIITTYVSRRRYSEQLPTQN